MFRLNAWTMWPCICLPHTFETLGERFHCNFWQEGVKKYQSFSWVYLTSKAKEVWTTKLHFPIHVQSRPGLTISGLIKTSTVAVGGSVVLKQTVLMPGLYHSWKIGCVADEIGFVWISNTVNCWRKKGRLVKNVISTWSIQHSKYHSGITIQECLLLTLCQGMPKCHLTSSTTNLYV